MLRVRHVVVGLGLAGALVPPAGALTFDSGMFAGLHWRLAGPFRGGRTVAATGVPGKPERFYFGAVGGGVWRSDNAGRTWEPILDAQPVASIGDLAVAPSDPNVIYVGSGEADMRSDIGYGNGVYKSVDGGTTWTHVGLTDTRQIGRIVVDPHDPNLVFVAALGHAYGPNRKRGVFRSKDGGKTWKAVLFENENTGAVDLALDPSDGRTILAALWQTRRPPWNVYAPSNGPGSGLYRSVDGGLHWDRLSPDLTREDPGVPSGLDPATAEDSDAKGPRRGVIYSIALSPVSDGRIWCGTDDGLIWLSRDDGRTWRNVTPASLGPWSKVGVIEASHFEAETAYAAIDRHRLDDLSAEILRTRDDGTTWVPIARGIPDGSFVNVVREDPVRRGLLYAGTETGVFVSFDDGERWKPLKLNLPTCSVRDIDVRHGDLVIATHGRSFWILDDVTPLRQLDATVAGKDLVLMAPRAAVRLHPAPFQGSPEPKDEPMAENPPSGAVLDYFVKSEASGRLVLEVLDAGGGLVRRYASDDDPRRPDVERIRTTPDWASVAEPPSAAAGMHRFVWDLRYAAPESLVDPEEARRPVPGPWAPPGRYTVRLTFAGRVATQPLVVVRDPRLPPAVTDADLVREYELARDVAAERARVAAGLHQAEALRAQIGSRRARATGEAAQALDALSGSIDRVAGPSEPGHPWEYLGAVAADPASLLGLSASLSEIQSIVESADAAPTPDMLAAFAERRRRADAGLTRWREMLAGGLPGANARLQAAGLDPLSAR